MQRDEFVMTVHYITEELSTIDKGSYWEIDPEKGHSSYIAIVNKNAPNEGLAIHYHDRENRFDIAANWPMSEDGHTLMPSRPYDHKGAWFSFGCTAAKVPVVIAKEISRRLLAEYRAKLAEVLAAEKERHELEDRRASLAEGICHILGLPYSREKKSNHGWPQVKLPYQFCPGINTLDVEVAGASDFRITFDCTDVLLATDIFARISRHIVSARKRPQPEMEEQAHA